MYGKRRKLSGACGNLELSRGFRRKHALHVHFYAPSRRREKEGLSGFSFLPAAVVEIFFLLKRIYRERIRICRGGRGERRRFIDFRNKRRARRTDFFPETKKRLRALQEIGGGPGRLADSLRHRRRNDYGKARKSGRRDFKYRRGALFAGRSARAR